MPKLSNEMKKVDENYNAHSIIQREYNGISIIPECNIPKRFRRYKLIHKDIKDLSQYNVGSVKRKPSSLLGEYTEKQILDEVKLDKYNTI